MQSEADKIVIVSPYNMAEYDQTLRTFYHLVSPQTSLLQRMEIASSLFMDKPYIFEPLGEGPNGQYYQEPIYRTDKFDCVTFVDTVLALAKSNHLAEFQENNLQIRYHQGSALYTNRTDWFTDLEWLPNGQKLNWITDVTSDIVKTNQCTLEWAHTIIDKPNWYQVKTLRALHLLQTLSQEEAEQRLMQLRTESQAFSSAPSSLSYIPLTALFNAKQQPNQDLFGCIPAASIIVLVRPNWPIRDKFKDYPYGYGTNLNVCHIGFALREQNQLMFYHASAQEGKVVCLPLYNYLQSFIGDEQIKGIHVEAIIA